MPTQTFLNLSLERQKKIIESAEKEFSQYLYEDASINRIIKNINMCRGTFYLYFKNKEDLYFYILSLMHKKNKETIIKISKKENRDIKKTFISFFDYITNKDLDSLRPLINNIFINFNTKHVERVIPLKCNKKEVIINLFDFSEYNIDDESKSVLLHILQTMLIQNIGLALRKQNDVFEIRKLYIQELDLILNGIERGNIC